MFHLEHAGRARKSRSAYLASARVLLSLFSGRSCLRPANDLQTPHRLEQGEPAPRHFRLRADSCKGRCPACTDTIPQRCCWSCTWDCERNPSEFSVFTCFVQSLQTVDCRRELGATRMHFDVSRTMRVVWFMPFCAGTLLLPVRLLEYRRTCSTICKSCSSGFYDIFIDDCLTRVLPNKNFDCY